MLIILVVLLGIMSYINTGKDLYPPVNIPVIVITTQYPGAGAEEIKKDIVEPIEDAVSGVSGVDKVNSTAAEGYSSTVVMFKLSADTTNAYIDTQKAVDSITYKLPKDAEKPTLLKYDPNNIPVIILTVSGDKEHEQLYNDADRLKDKLSRIPGVGQVSMSGGMEKELQINIDKSKLEFYGITISQIVQRLQAENLNFPGGTIKQSEQDKIVKISGEFKDINEIKSFRIPVRNSFIQLKDIADISLSYPNVKEISRDSGKPCISLSIQKQPDANVVETGDKILKEIEKMKPLLKGSNINIVMNATEFIKGSLSETQRNLIEGVFITSLVLFVFLRQFSSMLIVLISIPVSIVSTFFMMYVFGFTFNMLSLMGLALCVGILVDDSVVILENIHRHLKMGKDPKAAALDGRTEIGMAAIAITLCDIVVFAPIAFMSGIVGQYFRQFGLTVVFATLFSLIVSFTVTPMLASRMYKQSGTTFLKENFIRRFLNAFGASFQAGYISLLKWSLRHRFIVCGAILVLIVFAISLPFMGAIGGEFMPEMDTGEFYVRLELASGSNIQNTDAKTKIVENYLTKENIPELDYYYTTIGDGGNVNKSSIYVKLVNKTARKRTYKQVMDQVRDWGLNNLSGVSYKVTKAAGEGGPDSDKPVLINIKGPKMEVLKDIARKIEQIVKETPGTVEVSNSLESGQPEISINIDRLACAKYGFTVYDISNTIRSSLEGTKAGVFRKDGQEYDIRVKLQNNQILNEFDISNLKVSNNSGVSMSVGQLAAINLTQSPTTLKTLDKQTLASVSAYLKEGYTTAEVNAAIMAKTKDLKLMDEYSISFGGEQEDMQETMISLLQALFMSIALVYIVLVILYESFLTPFVRLLALPVGIIGALIMLAITGNTLNMFSMIGLIMLDGLAAKNGTLLIDYTNTLMHTKGLSLREALIEATKTRLKPIYMTSIAMIVGMLPTALALGDGAEFKSSMGIVIIGGITSSTLLSPILLPVAYTIMDDMKRFISGKIFRRKPKTQAIVESI